jgi:hypothetical protein
VVIEQGHERSLAYARQQIPVHALLLVASQGLRRQKIEPASAET